MTESKKNPNKKVALVTGASRGIGQAIAERLAAQGVEIILSGRYESSLEPIRDIIQSAGGKARIEAADLTCRDEVVALANRCGAVDILINNAACKEKFTSITDDEDAHWDETVNIVMWAPVLLTRYLSRHMKRNKFGVIVNVSTINANNPAPYMAPYCVAKAALETFTRVAAMELGPSGIRVNAIAPGIVRTQLTQELLGAFVDNLGPVVPAGRAAEPEEIASLAAYLCSDEASYINGSVLTIDGGMTAGNFGLAQLVNSQG